MPNLMTAFASGATLAASAACALLIALASLGSSANANDFFLGGIEYKWEPDRLIGLIR